MSLPEKHPTLPRQDYLLAPGADARKDPVRLVVLQAEARPAVDVTDEPMAMTVPHLVLRELIAFLALSLFLVLLALLVDAPLEELADPTRTPNPAKAPWYFLGLQELLHYYPPVVAGVILPGLVVFALAVVPYFDVNLRRRPLWDGPRAPRLVGLAAGVAALTALLWLTGAHAPWPILIPLWLIAAVMTLPALARAEGPIGRLLGSRSLAFWIFTWFLVVATVLTLIGVLFRGPGWSLTLPWREGIY
jgi:hypothetical protein